MREKILFIISWLAIAASLVTMIIGHIGQTDLSPVSDFISTYAARGPHPDWMTVSILLPCIMLASLALLVAHHRILGDSLLTHLLPLLCGSAIAGLVTLASFKETSPFPAQLQTLGFSAIRQQSFHDAGLMIFFFSGIALVILCGGLMMFRAYSWKGRVLGIVTLLLGLAAQPLMHQPWPHWLGMDGSTYGLQQRIAYTALWVGAMLILIAGKLNSRLFSRY